MTPEQMRALAERIEGYHSWHYEAEAAATLRAAADQIEAVREWAELELEGEQPNEYQRGYQMAAAHARRFVVTANTAPQEDRDE